MLPSLIGYLESNSNIKSKLSYTNSLINIHGLSIESEREINYAKKKINEFCGENLKRQEGILLLYAVVHSRSPFYVDNWHRIVEGSLKCPDSVISREIPLNILNRMIIHFASVTDHTEVFSKLLNDVLSLLLASDGDKIYQLCCESLALFMKYMPEIAGSRFNDIEEILVKELINPYGEVIEAIGDCFAALPGCLLHYHKAKSIEYKDIWCNLYRKFLNTMHLLLNNLINFNGGNKDYVDVTDLPVFVVPSSDDDPISQIDIVKSLCLCMAKMMSSENASVRLPITDVLEALFRILHVEKMLKHPNETVAGYFMVAFPHLLHSANAVFEALILNFNMLEQSHNFMNFILKSLDIMNGCFSQSSVDHMSGSMWKLVSIWLLKNGTKGTYELAKNNFILQKLVQDIDIEGKQPKSNNIEEKNQRLNTNKIFVCINALKVLKYLFELDSSYIEKDSVKQICSVLLRISSILMCHFSPRVIYPSPYSNEKCRKLLYDVLQTCILFCDSSLNKDFVDAAIVFKFALQDPSLKVTQLCHRFRKLSRYYLNPRKPPPDSFQFSLQPTLNIQQPVVQDLKSEWNKSMNYSNGNAVSSDDQMDDGESTHMHDQMDEGESTHMQSENAHSERIEENDLMPIEQEPDMNHDYGRITILSSQSVREEESVGESDLEPTYVSNDSNPPPKNDSSRLDSFDLQSCSNQYTNETRTDRQTADYTVPNLTNNVENNIEHTSFVEKSPKKVQMENGHWKKEDSDSVEDESDMDEEADDEGEVNEDNSGCDETSEGKRSPEFDEERPNKRQKFIDEEQEEEEEEDLEDEDIVVNSQLLSDEDTEPNHMHVSEDLNNSENGMETMVANTMANVKEAIMDSMEDDDENTDDGVPSLQVMLGDYCAQEAHQIS